MKINEAAAKFIKYAEHLEKKSASTIEHYHTSINRFQSFMSGYGEIEIEDVKIDHILDYAAYLDELEVYVGTNRTRKIRLSHNTKVALIWTIRSFFRRCRIIDLKTIPYEAIPVSKQKRNEICYLTAEEILSFFHLAQQEKKETIRLRNELFFRFAYYTWLRKWEILNLTFDEVLQGKQFQIIQKFDRKRTVFFEKESKIRELALQLKTLYTLKPKHQIHYHEEKDYIFICLNDYKRGKKRGKSGANVVIENYRKKLWIKKKATIHSFRHSYASVLLERGVDIRQVQVMLWHATIASTQVYTHISEKKLKSAVELLHIE